MEFYRRHLVRLDEMPEDLAAEIEAALFTDLNMDVYGVMWGPSEFNATGILGDYDRTDRLGGLSMPTLFTAGRHDEATPETTAWYASLVTGAQLEIIEDASHLTMVEQPERYAQVIREFLRGVDESAADGGEGRE